ncbi:TetR family transcriptional regulator [Nocardia zapadnayensis]|uniref:TetR/AcrR family transcriptional regulator n=1 Tax=Nocardia rhamnosiphila TaxID=426716 RepID=UPI0022461318|nr:TetR/AcrR family transcriptional regulator [Nocardia zapadnayensis]MCX0270901.1 TetR family transcriptional regulator [Nocardia zapadnayensis]
MPTGVALRDAREQLFAAARRVLLAGGPHGLTSRAVTTEAGVAKGVIHRHFTDFDAFLAEFVLDRIAVLDRQAATLRDTAGTGSVAANLATALTELFDPVAVAIVALIVSRDDLRVRLRAAGAAPIPVLGEGTAMIADYLTAERELGRISADADVTTLAPTLTGAAHLLFADRENAPTAAAVHRSVAAVLTVVLTPPHA